MSEGWPETRAAWGRLKEAWRDYRRSAKLLKAANLGIESANLYIAEGKRETGIRIAKAIAESPIE